VNYEVRSKNYEEIFYYHISLYGSENYAIMKQYFFLAKKEILKYNTDIAVNKFWEGGHGIPPPDDYCIGCCSSGLCDSFFSRSLSLGSLRKDQP
jgi:hypothetical protein